MPVPVEVPTEVEGLLVPVLLVPEVALVAFPVPPEPELVVPAPFPVVALPDEHSQKPGGSGCGLKQAVSQEPVPRKQLATAIPSPTSSR
jgi:hypothetical protein